MPHPQYHDENGKWKRNNTAGRGNALAKRMGQMRRKLCSAITAEDLLEIGAKLKEMALGGNVHAAKLLLDHTLGKPPQAIAVSGPDGTPLGLSLSDVQLAIFQVLGNDGAAKVRIATALRQLAHKEVVNGNGDARRAE